MKKQNKAVAKQYRLKRDVAPLCFMLSSHHNKRTPLLYFDEDKGINRALRYARNQKSPFEDEQDGNAIMEPIVFEDGFLNVDRGNQVLQEFLYYHPQNGHVYEEINNAKDAAEELEIEEIILDAQILAKELDLSTLESLSRVLFGSQADKRSTAELRRDMLVFSRTNPADFMDMLNDPSLQVYDDVSQFFGANLLIVKNKNRDVYFNLATNKTKMLTVPFGEDAKDIVASYMQTDQGVETYKLLNKMLKGDTKKSSKKKLKKTEE
ncbi:MAG: hypothetical protein Unbinned6224contig1000_35 [Prokaryotic dsDNA virus sp.]|nr:MAG: hypothetical protein Unbinned6224contig1000_35 [Prokaryotic dsDNA virus sp.]|tara:strand:- start:31075 stop:31869 length:795 start_codon:yes stop_codon:yes gene_type:complete